MTYNEKTKTLELTEADLSVTHKAKPPQSPKYFHFMDSIAPMVFHQADVITFKYANGDTKVMKDTYGKYQNQSNGDKPM